MVNSQKTSINMELLLRLAGLCLLICSADGNGPEIIKVIVTEDSDVILPCSLNTKENIESKLFDWKKDGQKEVFLYDGGVHYNNGKNEVQDEQFKGRVSHFEDELKSGNASIIIRKTKVADSGNYTCDFPRLQSSKIHIHLLVAPILKDRSEENISGAAPEPYVTILDQTDDGMLLQCVVRGAFPEPKVEWQDSAGNILPDVKTQVSERGGRFYITLNTTVTKTDRYRCVATQKDINHKTSAKIYVPLNEFPTGLVVGVSVFAAVSFILAVVVVKLCIKLKSKKGSTPERDLNPTETVSLKHPKQKEELLVEST